MIPTIVLIADTESVERIISEQIVRHAIQSERTVRITPQGAHITIDQVRWLKKMLSQSGGRQMLVVFELFDTATAEAQNALLKVLEEYGDSHIILILTRNIHAALPTIRSRCIIDQTQPVAKIIQDESFISSIPQRYSESLSEEVGSRPKTKEEIDLTLCTVIATLRSHIRRGDMSSVISGKQALHILRLVRNNNLNPQLAIDHWSLSQIDGTV
ncbi:MAG: hypothetical protein O3B87_03820 [bacterium]|nr:hypothetical protein [bacterium]